jgi:hypothetical protein
MLALLGATLGSAVGWWLGARVDTMTAFIFSVFGTGAGVYVGRRLAGMVS